MGMGRFLDNFKLKVVPGYTISLLDLVMFRKKLLGVAAPLNIYGRWREMLGSLVNEKHYLDAGLENLKNTYQSKADRQIMVIQCLRNTLLAGVEGIVAEFGCYRGHTAIQMIQTMRSLGDQSKFYLFDSFQGFPKSEAPEDASWREGDLAADFVEVAQRFEQFENAEIVKGFFKDILPVLQNRACKFAHADADLYTSIKEANLWLLDRVTPGGIIVYDDYGFANCPGAKRAIDEDLGHRSDFVKLYIPTGQYLAIKRG